MDTPTPPPILKGILKDRSEKSDAPANPRELALQHATILQHRKDLEARILDSVILLSEYPQAPSSEYTASNPAKSDVTAFKQHVRLFQPSDYDDLIEERNVNELCGYTLCGNPNRKTGSKSTWKISGSQIVKRKDVEKWCSPQCAKRALYVKVQLNETAAWERVGIPDIAIDLLDEDQENATEEEKVAQKMSEMKLEDQRQAAREQAALALERGEPTRTHRKPVLDNVVLKEKETAATDAADATFDASEDDHLMLEGHRTKVDSAPRPRQ